MLGRAMHGKMDFMIEDAINEVTMKRFVGAFRWVGLMWCPWVI
jgi:hypothetical protein